MAATGHCSNLMENMWTLTRKPITVVINGYKFCLRSSVTVHQVLRLLTYLVRCDGRRMQRSWSLFSVMITLATQEGSLRPPLKIWGVFEYCNIPKTLSTTPIKSPIALYLPTYILL